MKTNLKDYTYEELETWVVRELGEPKFRAKQIFTWLYRGVTSCGDDGSFQGPA